MLLTRSFSLILLVLFVAGCSTIEKERRNVIVLIDYSASSSKDVLNEYIKIISYDIIPNMKPFDCLTVIPIDEGSKKIPVKLIHEDFTDMKFNKNSDGFTHAQDSILKRLEDYRGKLIPKVDEILKLQHKERRKFTYNTDLIGAIEQVYNLLDINKIKHWERAANFIVGKPTYIPENIIVILSDMIQDSEEYSFNNRIGIGEKKGDEIIEELKANNLIADLNSSNVFVIGSTGKNSQQIDNIKDFWQKYFKKSNANLVAYGYDVEDKLKKYLRQ